MALAARVIPVMLCRGHSLVKGRQFVNTRVVGHALQAARTHAARGVDELMLIEIGGQMMHPDLVEELTRDIFVPVTIGGGIRTMRQIDTLLRAGADKVLLGSQPDPIFLFDAFQRYGSQAIVVSVDDYSVETARRYVELGAGEILLNNIERDGTQQGYDLDLIGRVSRAVIVPVIACGGCRDYDDMVSAIRAGASAVAAGALFAFDDCTPAEAALHLQAHGIEARVE
jgi:cyclase